MLASNRFLSVASILFVLILALPVVSVECLCPDDLDGNGQPDNPQKCPCEGLTDDDCDGIPDAIDYCPCNSNISDIENDGVPDCADKCSKESNPGHSHPVDCNCDGDTADLDEAMGQQCDDIDVQVEGCTPDTRKTDSVVIDTYETFHAVTIMASYSHDFNRNNHFSFEYSLQDPLINPNSWVPGLDMVRKTFNPNPTITGPDKCRPDRTWRGTVYPLDPGTTVWIKVNGTDPDSQLGITVPVFSVMTKKFVEQPTITAADHIYVRIGSNECEADGSIERPWPTISRAIEFLQGRYLCNNHDTPECIPCPMGCEEFATCARCDEIGCGTVSEYCRQSLPTRSWPATGSGVKIIVQEGVYKERIVFDGTNNGGVLNGLSCATAESPLIVQGRESPTGPRAVIDNSINISQGYGQFVWEDADLTAPGDDPAPAWKLNLSELVAEQLWNQCPTNFSGKTLSTVVIDGKRTLGYLKFGEPLSGDPNPCSCNSPCAVNFRNDSYDLKRAYHWSRPMDNTANGCCPSNVLYVRTADGLSPSMHEVLITTAGYGTHDDAGVTFRRCSNIVFEGFEVRHSGGLGITFLHGGACVPPPPTERILVKDCSVHHNRTGVWVEDYHVRDIALWSNEFHEEGLGDYPWKAFKDGVIDTGDYFPPYGTHRTDTLLFADQVQGLSLKDNHFHDAFDLIQIKPYGYVHGNCNNGPERYLDGHCDVFNNTFDNAGDDAMEVDGSERVVRIHGNTINNALTGISITPLYDGPVWITRNTIRYALLGFKMNSGYDHLDGDVFLYHNSLASFFTDPSQPCSLGAAISFPSTYGNLGPRRFINNAYFDRGTMVRGALPTDRKRFRLTTDLGDQNVEEFDAVSRIVMDYNAYAWTAYPCSESCCAPDCLPNQPFSRNYFEHVESNPPSELFCDLSSFVKSYQLGINGPCVPDYLEQYVYDGNSFERAVEEYAWVDGSMFVNGDCGCNSGNSSYSSYFDHRAAEFSDCPLAFADLRIFPESELKNEAIAIDGLPPVSDGQPDIGAHEAATPCTTCDDHNPCTEDLCDMNGFCLPSRPDNGAPCDDGNPCTYGDSCFGGECQSGQVTSCLQGNCPPCDDGNLCTVGDYCQKGVCIGGPLLNCDEGNPCTVDFCVPPMAECGHSSEPDCNDNNCVDSQDLASGTSQDANGNGVPDECEGPILFVDVNGPDSDCSSWERACRDLQVALAVARGDGVKEIRVADGVYTPSQNQDRRESFMLQTRLAIRGGYAGSGEANSDCNDPLRYESVLSGDLRGDDGQGNTADNSYHVVTAESTDVSAVLDGFTIQGGNANGTYDHSGAGMYIQEAEATVSRCTFVSNVAAERGGAVYYNRGRNETLGAAFVNCRFIGNVATDAGGATYIFYVSPQFTNCVFDGNEANRGGGGAAYVDRASPVITNCSFSFNQAGGYGGGIFHAGSATTLATVTNSIFWENSGNPSGTSVLTDEIFDPNEMLTVSYCCVQDSRAGDGRVYRGQSNLDLDPLFIDNDGADNRPGTLDDNLRLDRESPCMDTGNDGALPLDTADVDCDTKYEEIIPWDLDERPRQNDSWPGNSVVDMGAYERKQ